MDKAMQDEGNVVRARVVITGTRPFLWHAFTPEAMSGEKREREGTPGNDPGEWRRTVLALPTGELYIDPTYVFSCLVGAGKHAKKGRGTLLPLVAATLQVVDAVIPTGLFLPAGDDVPPQDPTQAVYMDVRGVRNPTTKGRNVRYRTAARPGWSVTFTIEWDASIVSRWEMEAVLIDAGRLIGLGDGRAVGFGRFSVAAFDVKELTHAKKAPAA